MAAADLTLARVRELLAYDPETGALVWRVGRHGPKARAGAVAGTVTPEGYRIAFVDGRKYPAHRLIWFYVTGRWPAGVIDHKNGKKDDNRFSNLRDVPQRVNTENKRAGSKNRVGLRGVTMQTRGGGFHARITVKGKTRSIGTFPTAEAASAAYLKEKRRLHSAPVIDADSACTA